MLTWTIFIAPIAASCSVAGVPAPSLHSPTPTTNPIRNDSAPIRQTDDLGTRLPFTTTFPDRWSTKNDGTTYEPCTALTDAELSSVGIDPATAQDVALANYQTARGCVWLYHGQTMGRVSHFTGDKPTFNEQRKNRESYILSYDTMIEGRQALVDARHSMCTITVESEDAPVSTLVTRTWRPPPIAELCAQAIAFTKLTIPKMPPPAP
ncbi:MAG: DUF3558 family protein [Gordonia amarae]